MEQDLKEEGLEIPKRASVGERLQVKLSENLGGGCLRIPEFRALLLYRVH